MNYICNNNNISPEYVQSIFDNICAIAKMSGWTSGYSVTPEAHENIMKLAAVVKLHLPDPNDREFVLNQLLLNRKAHEKKLLKKYKFIKKKNFYGEKFDQEIAKLEKVAPMAAYSVGLVDEMISCLHIQFNDIKIFHI